MNNYVKMIEILEWVKAARQDREAYNLGASPYLCDNVNRFFADTQDTLDARQQVRGDIRSAIDHRFGVAEYLGYDTDADAQDANEFPDVLAFRAALIETLIARYTAKVVA